MGGCIGPIDIHQIKVHFFTMIIEWYTAIRQKKD